MAKCIRDGKVAVIFSFDDRWSLMVHDGNDDFFLHDDVLVSLIEARQFDEIPEFVAKQFPESDFWWLDNGDRLQNLVIKWVPIGTKFRVVSLVDGMGEMVEILNINDWKTA